MSAVEIPGFGFAVTVKTDCPHIPPLCARMAPPTDDLARALLAAPCSECGDCRENWVNVADGKVLCSRYVSGHMLDHVMAAKASAAAAGTGGVDGTGTGTEAAVNPCVAISFSDLSVWCFECDSYCSSPSTNAWLLPLRRAKFGPDASERADAGGPAMAAPELGPSAEPGADAPCEPAGPISAEPGQAATAAAGAGAASDALSEPAGAAAEAADSDDSSHGDDVAPDALAAACDPSRTEDFVAGILDGTIRRIAVLAGAGLSVSAGIPDFRSSAGIYKNLAKFGVNASELERPEDLFCIEFFRENPEPFYAASAMLFAKDATKPTPSHFFLRLLHEKGLLRRVLTQNIDGLELAAGVPQSRVVQCHGGMTAATCTGCGRPADIALVNDAIQATAARMAAPGGGGASGAVVIPHCPACGGVVKPNITFFGEDLPPSFYRTLHHDFLHPSPAGDPDADPCDDGPIDALIVMGTSLQVAPVSSVPQLLPKDVRRLLLNMEPVGEIGSLPGDAVVLGDLDSSCAKLAEQLGWTSELEGLVREAAA